MNFYKRFIGDIQAKTGGLSLAEFGAYDRLLDHYYSTESPLPIKVADCYRIARAMDELERAAVDKVLAQFFDETPAGFVQSKAEEIILAALPLIEAARENGRKGGRPRKEKPTGFSGETEGFSAGESGSGEAIGQRDESSTDELQNTGEKPAGLFLETQKKPSTKASQSQKVSPSLRSGDSAGKPRISRPKKVESTLQAYLDVCKASGVKPVPPEHAIRAWCADAGISTEMLQVAWCVFRDDHLTGKNKANAQKDWPAHFANSVRRGWYRLWYTGDNGVAWTSTGLTEKQVLENRQQTREAHAPA